MHVPLKTNEELMLRQTLECLNTVIEECDNTIEKGDSICKEKIQEECCTEKFQPSQPPALLG